LSNRKGLLTPNGGAKKCASASRDLSALGAVG
jgi:hypothetical protein